MGFLLKSIITAKNFPLQTLDVMHIKKLTIYTRISSRLTEKA